MRNDYEFSKVHINEELTWTLAVYKLRTKTGSIKNKEKHGRVKVSDFPV